MNRDDERKGNLKPFLVPTKLMTDAEKQTGTRLDVIEINERVLAGWADPPFQRPLKTGSPKFARVVEKIKADGVIPGVITLAVVEKQTYVLDGQHRIAAFRQTELSSVYADVRIHHFDSLADAGEEWVNGQEQITRRTPDDVLRGMEGKVYPLAMIRKKCPFVGYDCIRRSQSSPVVSMSAVIRCWRGSAPDVPTNGGESATDIARTITEDEAEQLSSVLNLFWAAWNRDSEYHRLWGSLNMVLCMWLYRRMVISTYSQRSSRLTRDQFKVAIQALSAHPDYLSWLVGRQLRESDRSPGYSRLKTIFAKRMAEVGLKLVFPSPAWVTTHR